MFALALRFRQSRQRGERLADFLAWASRPWWGACVDAAP